MEKCIFCDKKTEESIGIVPTNFMRSIYFAVCEDCMKATPIIKLFKIADGMIREDFRKQGVNI